jgi:hypothetical protein
VAPRPLPETYPAQYWWTLGAPTAHAAAWRRADRVTRPETLR